MPLKFKPGSAEYREYHRNWNRNNRPGQQLNKIEKRDWVKQIKQDKGCGICGFRNPASLQFHHRNRGDKKASISIMVRDNRPYEIIQSEIDKCDLICANCHAKQTFKDMGYGETSSRKYLEAREWLRATKAKSKCVQCGYSDPSGLHFHHKNPANKINSVANGVSKGWRVSKLQAEADKCVVLCANCHFILHHGEHF